MAWWRWQLIPSLLGPGLSPQSSLANWQPLAVTGKLAVTEARTLPPSSSSHIVTPTRHCHSSLWNNKYLKCYVEFPRYLCEQDFKLIFLFWKKSEIFYEQLNNLISVFNSFSYFISCWKCFPEENHVLQSSLSSQTKCPQTMKTKCWANRGQTRSQNGPRRGPTLIGIRAVTGKIQEEPK